MELPDYIKNRYWKDYLPLGVTLEINIPEDLSLVDIFEKGLENYSNKVSIIYGEKEFTYKEMNNLTVRFANGLIKLGVKKGDVVAL